MMSKRELLISEQKKAARAFEKATGHKAFVGGYGCRWEDDFTEVRCEMDDKETGKYLGEVTMQLTMFDRRRSWVSSVEEY